MKFYAGLLLFLLAGTAFRAFPQFTGHRLYTVADGLVQSEVVEIHQDKKGFLWIGTKNGVSRFDGHTFTTISDSAHLIRSWVSDIADLDDSAVVILTKKGYILYEYHRYHNRITSSALPPGTLAGFWVFRNNFQVAMNTPQGVIIYEADRNGTRKTDEQVAGVINQRFQPGSIQRYFRTNPDGNLCFLDSSGQLCSADKKKVSRLGIYPNNFFFFSSDGALCGFTPSAGKNKLTDKNGRVRLFIGKEIEPVRMFRIRNGQVEFLHDFGPDYNVLAGVVNIPGPDYFVISDFANKAVKVYKKRIKSVYTYDISMTGAVLIDREGNFWMGSPLGLVRSMPVCFANYGEKQGLFPNGQFLAEDKYGQIITGSYEKGLQVLRQERFIHVPFPTASPLNELRIIYPGGGRNRAGDVIICATPNTAIGWNGDHFFEIPGLPKPIALYYYEDMQTGIEYFGALNGLYSKAAGKPDTLIPVTPGNKSNRIVSIVTDGAGRLLIGGFQGMSMIEGESVRHLPDKEFPFSLGANAMVKDHRGNTWIGNSDGLFLFDNLTFRKIVNPWFNDLVLSLCQVDSSALFIGGLRGIGFLDLKKFYQNDTAIIRFFDRDNGFIGAECQQNAAIRSSDGAIWVGATNSVVKINPAMLPAGGMKPLVYLSEVSMIDAGMRQTALITSEIHTGQLSLTHEQNNLRFDFTGIWFTAPKHLRFSYTLEGHESAWSVPGEERFAVYTNLSPGEYKFKVMVINDQGVRSEYPASLVVTIHPAIWQTWWFRILSVLILVSVTVFITWMIARRIRNRQKNELETKRTIAELRFKTLRNQLAPHFIFNALNVIGSAVFQKPPAETYDLLHKFSRLIRQSLMHADKTTVTLAEEISFVQYYLDIENIRFENRMQYTIFISPEINPDMPVPRMIIQTFVENAVKHGLMHKEGPGNIRISVQTENDALRMIIEDDGIGRSASVAFHGDSTGKGMEIMREFLKLYNSFNDGKIEMVVSDLFTPSREAAGTRVQITIPQSYSYSLDHEEYSA
jgi:two-component sensor histidine kinase